MQDAQVTKSLHITKNVCYTTVKHVLSGHSKLDKTEFLKTNGSLIKVKNMAKWSLGAFCNTCTIDLH